jgi:hypothetical protein
MRKKNRIVILIATALMLPGALMMLISMSGGLGIATPPRPEGPCYFLPTTVLCTR